MSIPISAAPTTKRHKYRLFTNSTHAVRSIVTDGQSNVAELNIRAHSAAGSIVFENKTHRVHRHLLRRVWWLYPPGRDTCATAELPALARAEFRDPSRALMVVAMGGGDTFACYRPDLMRPKYAVVRATPALQLELARVGAGRRGGGGANKKKNKKMLAMEKEEQEQEQEQEQGQGQEKEEDVQKGEEQEMVGFVRRTRHSGKKEYEASFEKGTPKVLAHLVMWLICWLERKNDGIPFGAEDRYASGCTPNTSTVSTSTVAFATPSATSERASCSDSVASPDASNNNRPRAHDAVDTDADADIDVDPDVDTDPDAEGEGDVAAVVDLDIDIDVESETGDGAGPGEGATAATGSVAESGATIVGIEPAVAQT